jgi:CheY-like chemotaxis protein
MTTIEQPTVHLAPTKTFRILTLENPENIEKLKECCRHAGHEVVPVRTIQEAMAFLDSKDHVDLIISAVHLQNESVLEFLTLVKTHDSVHKEVVFVMLCLDPGQIGSVTNDLNAKAGEMMGADKYLLMPVFDAAKLMLEIASLLPEMPAKEERPLS